MKIVRNNALVLENGKLKPKYTVKEKYTDIVVATVSCIEDALRIKGDNEDIQIFNEATKQYLKFGA